MDPWCRRRRTLAVGTLAALAVGIVVAGLTIRVDVSDPPSAVQVPALHHGDSGTYVITDGSDQVGAVAFHVGDAAPVVPRDGGFVSAPVMRFSAVDGDSEAFLEQRWAGGEVVREDRVVRQDGFVERRATWRGGESVIPYLDLSGSALLATGPPPADQAWPLSWWTLEGPGPLPTAMACEAGDLRTAGGAFIDGRDAVGLEVELECDGSIMTRTAWFTDQAPVPELIAVEGGGDRLALSLVEFRRGDGDAVVPAEERTIAPAPAKGPRDAATPSRGQTLPYPLAEALDDIRLAPELVAFQVWLQQHPDAQIVGMRLMAGQHSWAERVTDRWIFVFAEGTEARQVSTERARTETSWWVQDDGARSIEPGAIRAVPDRMVTLDAATQIWRDVAGETYASSTPNFVQWGAAPDLAWSPDCEFVPPETGLLPTEARRDRIIMGHSTYGTCTDPKVVREESYVLLDAGSGDRLELVEHRIELAAFPEGEVSRTAPLHVSDTASAVDYHVPDFERAVLVTAPLLVALWMFYFWPAVKVLVGRLPLAWGYSRVLEDDVLQNEVRRSIVAAIEADPGITASELAAPLGIGWGSLAHHTDILEKAGKIVTEHAGRNRHYFLAASSPGERLAGMALRHEGGRRVWQTVCGHPGISQQDLADQVGMTPAGVLWHTKRLTEAGLLRRQRTGRFVCHYATPRV